GRESSESPKQVSAALGALDATDVISHTGPTRWFRREPFVQLRPPAPSGGAAHGDRYRLSLSDQNDQTPAAREAGVEQVSLQHGIVLRQHRNHDRRVFRALALVDRDGVGRHQRVELTEAVAHQTAVETHYQLAQVGLDGDNVADIAVVHLLVVIVFDL